MFLVPAWFSESFAYFYLKQKSVDFYSLIEINRNVLQVILIEDLKKDLSLIVIEDGKEPQKKDPIEITSEVQITYFAMPTPMLSKVNTTVADG